ncbi:uncharacterized protein OCT59_008893 [Rhizophagus irregularis]|uniref:Serine-enriched protein n=5 Tax=Rhizophagus irregularis TaxID=588596 RepID=A0A015KMI0_RHIIW|nr:hypothetical protein GLOIN_2v1761969 [Rhizophagus irregularis DAOM 181602=DAOM 197198]EXX68704.1 hypothetical protein RirG_102800 [Rhizophagus irregularis DAOM 197198w]POG82572.1 hypothetical protein GLOIN_2v1761969 [Rhizophagus irregularis DAOM 181602=DAOM 197198]UZO17542.1 hypothetical protein OCT59_008893 [Rhizophagus irregularis]GBC24189.2 hypothetical protein GLOIN_2v1761969 [Rhizophagus irregularis DAOM 181602=DAOM 197198]|eukprot:XP_025189438.1 hypothetical protein GLOIN_2v1761969 [Rhizophagus irregularis DAOM 181602=DAOM 197198]
MTSMKLFDRLSEDLGQLLEKEENYDMVIHVGGEENKKEFKAHSLILSTRSSYFKSALNNHWTIKQHDGKIIFKKPNISPKVFQFILKYLYTGVINFHEQELREIFDLLIAADELILDELKDQIQEYLIEHEYTQIQQNIVQVLHIVFGHDVTIFKKLRDYSVERVCNNPEILFDSSNFVTLEKHILVELLKRDDLGIEEVKIWQHLIKWGVAHTPLLSNVKFSELSNWTITEFNALEKTLHDCLPLIRYFQMSSDDIYKNVFPYKKILNKQLKQDIVAYFMSSDYQPKSLLLPSRSGPHLDVDSLLITNDCCLLLETWIKKGDRLTTNNTNKPLSYNWKLLYRASRDSYDAMAFHRRCNDQGACIIVAKIAGKNERLVGGYNPIGWFDSGGQYSAAPDAFLFSIENKDLNNAKISRVLPYYASKAIFQEASCTVNFGAPDLLISSHCNKNISSFFNTTSFYEYNIIIGNFKVIDYEVFQIIKKENSRERRRLT